MFTNYIKLAFRNLRKNPVFSTINALGLSIGLACCMLIARYVAEETNFDRHHERANDLYRLGTTFINLSGDDKGVGQKSFGTSAALAAALQQEFGEVEKTTRLLKLLQHDKTLVRVMEDSKVTNAFNEPGGYFADSTFFELFRYEFLEGQPAAALREPGTVAISDVLAHKYFGEQRAEGRILRISSDWFEGGEMDLRVSGVFRQPNAPSQIKGKFFMPMHSGNLVDFLRAQTDMTRNNMFATYLRLQPGADGPALEAKFPAFVEKYMAPNLKSRGMDRKQFLTAVPDVHLSDVGRDSSVGSKTYLFLLGSVALFTLLIACVNFMNLSTARASKRAAEVGARKAAGASQWQLIQQFLGESVLIALCSFGLALIMAQMALPLFNQMSDQHLSFDWSSNCLLFGSFLGLALLTGIVAGIYPAFYLSSFRPVAVLKGHFSNRFSVVLLRKALVVFQFVISAGLILASVVIGTQLHYLQHTDLGFQKDRQIALPLASPGAGAAYDALKATLGQDSRVASVGASRYYPGIMNPSDAMFYRQGQTADQAVATRQNWVDPDLCQTLQFKAVAGRLFSPQFPGDTLFKILINETAAKKYGFASPTEAVGQPLLFTHRNGDEFRFEIVGVVRDFHFESLHEPIAPYSFLLNRGADYNYLIVRAQVGADMPALVEAIGQTWKKLVPGEPLEYSFIEDDFQKNYTNDRQMAGLVGTFTGIAILISCLGLFGLAAFAAEQRTKEIGVRKVLGASVAGITALLAKDFLKLVLLAIVIASPLAWYVMQKWLANFAYSIDIQAWMFAATGLTAATIAFLTVAGQALRAALANPVKSLRSE